MDPSTQAGYASEEAMWKQQRAQECRAFARNGLGVDQLDLLSKADILEQEARATLNLSGPREATTTIGCGGEMAMAIGEVRRHVDKPGTAPDLVTVDASRTRLSLAKGAGVLPLALDAAESANATVGIEQMMAHQVAAAHAAAMRLVGMGMGALTRHEQHELQFAFLGTEGVRLVGAGARLMEAAQRAALTLNKLKTAGHQTLVVQHVHIADGGQAVVAGAMDRNQRQATFDLGHLKK